VSRNTVFVKFDQAIRRLGWEGCTAQGCCPTDLYLSLPEPEIF
jgi:hypothetical protein